LHIIEEAYIAEIVEPHSGKMMPAGRTGELILTPLGRLGSPVLRYRTGDLVKSGVRSGARDEPPCACGRYDLALEGGILGRVDDMVVIRGVNVFPSAVEEILVSSPGVAEYQVEVSTSRTLPELSLQVEPVADCSDVAGLVRQLESRFEAVFALRVAITLVPVGTLPRSEMKSKRWVKR